MEVVKSFAMKGHRSVLTASPIRENRARARRFQVRREIIEKGFQWAMLIITEAGAAIRLRGFFR